MYIYVQFVCVNFKMFAFNIYNLLSVFYTNYEENTK